MIEWLLGIALTGLLVLVLARVMGTERPGY